MLLVVAVIGLCAVVIRVIFVWWELKRKLLSRSTLYTCTSTDGFTGGYRDNGQQSSRCTYAVRMYASADNVFMPRCPHHHTDLTATIKPTRVSE